MSRASDSIHWKLRSRKNKGGRPQYSVSYDGQVTTRVRRGVTVEIPEEWRGHVTNPQTIRKRPSKHLHKLRKIAKYGSERLPKPAERAALAYEEDWTE